MGMFSCNRCRFTMRYLSESNDGAEAIRKALTARDSDAGDAVEAAARAIIADVRARGDEAVADYTRRFDWPGAAANALAVSDDERKAALQSLSPDMAGTLAGARTNIERFHRAERGHLQSWFDIEPREEGRLVGQVLAPVERAGVYVPGAKADYPSTVLMAALPAMMAGVKEIILCSPPDRDGSIPALVAAASWGIADKVFRIGGAQAVAAMAYGTETVPKVDVIVGPGNAYVNAAKRLVYGEVGIDMLAGPSEVAIIADDAANPGLVAADLITQTEHSEDNRGVLFSPSMELLHAVEKEVVARREKLSRRAILEESAKNLLFVHTESIEGAIALSNVLAPEHLEMMVREPMTWLPRIKNAGAVLLGEATSAPLGDYWAGPSHTLPTAGTARFSSPLSVATFMKRTSIISYSAEGASKAAEDIARFAEAEGFDGHAAAARERA
jgi:histidinol dehydrogenase